MLDEHQKEAVKTIDGPVLCVAGPGAGKTTVIVHHVLYMVQHGIKPDSILVLSFGNTDADNAKKRYESLDGAVAGPVFSTIHAFAWRIIRESVPINFRVLSETDQTSNIEAVLKDIQAELVEQKKMTKKEAVRILPNSGSAILDISRYKTSSSARRKNFKPASGISLDLFLKIYNAYETVNEASDAIDFDDMLIMCRELLKSENVLHKYQTAYPYIIIDEFQDTNDLQASILYKIAAPANNIFACGDEDQSIYGFRNANPDIMLRFPKKFPDARVIKLTNNYRSGEEIVDASARLISHNRKRFQKKLTGCGGEGEITVLRVPDMQNQYQTAAGRILKSGSFGSTAMLCRTNQEVLICAQALARQNIPVTTPGTAMKSPYDGVLFKTLLSYLHMAYGAYTADDIRQTANRPFRYIGLDIIRDYGSSLESLRKYAVSSANVWKRRAVLGYLKTMQTIQCIAEDEKMPFYEQAEKIFAAADIDKWIAESCEDRFADPGEMETSYRLFLHELPDFGSLIEYEEHVAVSFEKFTAEAVRNKDNKNAVQVLTMHRAKGKEWDYVYILSCNDGNLPHENFDGSRADEEEERRLFYVAATRARKELCMVRDWNKAPSIFINETAVRKEGQT